MGSKFHGGIEFMDTQLDGKSPEDASGLVRHTLTTCNPDDARRVLAEMARRDNKVKGPNISLVETPNGALLVGVTTPNPHSPAHGYTENIGTILPDKRVVVDLGNGETTVFYPGHGIPSVTK